MKRRGNRIVREIEMPFRLESFRSQDLAGELRNLTFPAVAKIVQDRYPDTARLIAARMDDVSAGLAVAVPGPNSQFELLSLYVVPFFRRLGIGSAILRATETQFRDIGYRLGVHFMSIGESDDAHARFFVAHGWSRPVVTKLLCESTVPLALDTPWLVEARLPDRYRIIDWLAVAPARREQLRVMASTWIDEETDPFLHELNCDAATSLALEDVHSGMIHGWVITHRLDRRTLRWTCSYLRPELQRHGLMRALWLAVVQRQALQPELSDFIFTVPVGQPRMARFALRRMRPWLSRLAYACTSMKKVV